MFVGIFLVLLGEVLLFRSTLLLWYSVLWFAIFNVNIWVNEEPYLRARFGESYEHYRNQVGRWIPGRPYISATTENDS